MKKKAITHTTYTHAKQRQLLLHITLYDETPVSLGRMMLETIFSLILQNSDIQNRELYNLQFLPQEKIELSLLGPLAMCCILDASFRIIIK